MTTPSKTDDRANPDPEAAEKPDSPDDLHKRS